MGYKELVIRDNDKLKFARVGREFALGMISTVHDDLLAQLGTGTGERELETKKADLGELERRGDVVEVRGYSQRLSWLKENKKKLANDIRERTINELQGRFPELVVRAGNIW